jgi:hypothetical protein
VSIVSVSDRNFALPRSQPAHPLAPPRGCKYTPELNDIEPVWRDLKAYNLAHQTFTDAEAPTAPSLNAERNIRPLVKRENLCYENSRTDAFVT